MVNGQLPGTSGPKVNSGFRDYSPRISPDGKYLFFTSEKDFSAGVIRMLLKAIKN